VTCAGRIVSIGNAAAGRSYLAHALASQDGLPLRTAARGGAILAGALVVALVWSAVKSFGQLGGDTQTGTVTRITT
jgi:hypothetical protein